MLRSMAAQKQIDVTMHVDPDVGIVVVDPGKREQVLYDFLSNVLKFTPDNGRVHVRALASGATEFQMQVEDTRRQRAQRAGASRSSRPPHVP
jgi:signal transduction histidine kinase